MDRCRRCHRQISEAESIERGYGPTCWQRQAEDKQTALQFDRPSGIFKPGMSILEQYLIVKKICGGSK